MPHERPPVRVFPVKGMRINVSTDITVQYSTVQYSTVQTLDLSLHGLSTSD